MKFRANDSSLDLYSITGGGSRKIEYLDDSGVRCTQCKTYIDHYDEIDELRYYHCPNCFFNWRSFYLPKPQASTQSQVIQQTAQHVLEPDQSVKRESEIRPSDSVGEHHHHESQKAKVALDTDSFNQSTSQKSESEAVVQSGEAVVQSASSTRIYEADIRAAPAAKQTPSVNHDHHSPIQRSSTNEYEERKAAAREKRLLRFHMKPYTPANLSDAVTSSGRVYSATKDCDEPTEPDDDGLLERKRASALAALHKIPTKPEDKAAMTRSSREASNVVVPEESVASNRTGVTAINDRLDNWAFSAPLDDWVINIPEVSSPPSSSSTSTARQQASTNDRKRYRSKSPSYTGSRHQPSSRHRNDGQSEGGRRDSRRPGSVAASSNVRYGRNDPRDYNRYVTLEHLVSLRYRLMKTRIHHGGLLLAFCSIIINCRH